jgi:2-polyprenyl-3-methyl-5-hydroxy-6-metoxy-1,4-benzoquinol methylase
MIFDENYSNWKDWNHSNFGKTSLQDIKYFDAQINPLIKSLHNSRKRYDVRVLELGFGNGNFLNYCKTNNLNVTGVELNESLLKIAKSEKFDVIDFESFKKNNDNFDLIVAFDVLEHVPPNELEQLFVKLSNCLNKEGCIFFRFPNGDSPFGLVNQNGDITHVSSIGSFKISHLADVASLDVERVCPPAQPLIAGNYLITLHRLIFGPVKMFLNFLIKIIMFPDKKIYFFSTNLTATLRKKTKQNNR